MSTTVHCAGKRLRLHDRDLLGVGGEGSVYRAGDRAIKIFFALDDARRAKLVAFAGANRALPPRVVGPLDLCHDTSSGDIVGYAMKALDGAVDIHRVAQRRWREQSMTANDVVAIFREIVTTLEALHARSIVVGDLNDGNVVLTQSATSKAWTPSFIDADSMQLPGHPCVVAHERFLDPRLYGVDLSKTLALSMGSDWYALAVMLFASLTFIHPYGGAHASYPTLLRRAEARHSILRGDVKLPNAALRPDVLTDDALAWFHAVFEKDRRDPLPSNVLEARFTKCGCGVEHARKTCPVCTVRVAAPAAIVTRGKMRATRLHAIPSQATPSLSEIGAIAIEGEWLVRRSSGTRIGQILEGQTHVKWGASMGFAFYRASSMTVFFVFDPRQGPLRQITLPPIDGRLVEWNVVFDAGHALFTTATEKGGKVTHGAWLVASSGEVLAAASGAQGSSPILGAVTGKCLAGGAVLTATDDGLVLLRADRSTRTFVPIRAFPETRDLVPPDADLLVGPGGSVYVVSHDGVVHLCFEGNP